MDYSFNLYNQLASSGICISLKNIIENPKNIIILCIGSDLSVGDSLGPITGTLLKEKLYRQNVFVYGTLSKPITAREVKYINPFLKSTHPESLIIAIDAAVGESGDIGLIKVCKKGLKPGSGADKKLNKVGDISILGIVAEHTLFNYSLFSATRLNIIYKMANIISEGIASYIIESSAK
jgi:putative sporulation protein YyaC